MQIVRGFVRLGILLTVCWLVSVFAFVAFEFSSSNPFCRYDPKGTFDALCQHYFWSWEGEEAVRELSPQMARLLIYVAAIPIAGWLLGLASAWVIRGFKDNGAI
jgi:hypothetical protein